MRSLECGQPWQQPAGGEGADHAQRQLGGLQAVAAARVEAKAGDQHAGIRSIILDQVAAGRIGRGEDALADAEDHVLLLEPARVQAFQSPTFGETRVSWAP
ncbi:hypothetical protein G6F24_016311 [Rhizopus arrhizus]|nr:hypothetical protein G6F24_016311 [Rhizopus arrhizus]